MQHYILLALCSTHECICVHMYRTCVACVLCLCITLYFHVVSIYIGTTYRIIWNWFIQMAHAHKLCLHLPVDIVTDYTPRYLCQMGCIKYSNITVFGSTTCERLPSNLKRFGTAIPVTLLANFMWSQNVYAAHCMYTVAKLTGITICWCFSSHGYNTFGWSNSQFL